MKKIKFIFMFGIIIGLFFIGSNVLKGNTISIDKKNVNTPKISNQFYGSISNYFGLVNLDQNKNSMINSKFKMTTWNNQYTVYSSYDADNDYYQFYNYQEININKVWSLLSDSQKEKINDITTYGDFYNVFKDNDDVYCYKATDGTAACHAYLGTYFILEQTKVATNYTKEKYVVPGLVYLYYSLDDSSSYSSGYITNIPDNTAISLDYVSFSSSIDGVYALLKYDNYDEIFNITSFEEYDNLIANNIVYTEDQCIRRQYAEQTKAVQKIAGSSGTSIKEFKRTVGDVMVKPYYYECVPLVVNKKGEVNLSINTTVNEKESISTTSNSKLTYKINISNTGTTSYDNTVISKLPEEFVYVDGTASNGGVYDPNTHTVTWIVNRIDQGENITLTYEAYAPNGLSNLKSYVGEASVESSTSQKVISNKTTVRLMANPKTNAPLYGIGITLLITWGVALYLYLDNKRKLIKN